jgi:hypothetical protein
MSKQIVELEGVLYGRKAIVQVEALGKCPACGAWVFDSLKDYKGEPTKTYNCQNWFNKSCNFGIWKVFSQKTLLENIVIELLDKGVTAETVKGLKSQAGKTFEAKLMIDKTDHKVKLFKEESSTTDSGKQSDSGEKTDSDGSDE